MAYKINRRTSTTERRPNTSTALATMSNDPPLVTSLLQYLRAGNVGQLERLSRTAAREASSERVTGRGRVALLIVAAAAARTIGDLTSADAWLAQADASLPACSHDLLAGLRREQVRLLLDRGSLRAALQLAAQLDCTVIERGMDTPLITRDEAAMSADSLLVQAEVALAACAVAQAFQLLDVAHKLLEAQEKGGLSRAEATLVNDRYDYLRLLHAVYVCRSGETERGSQMLMALVERLEMSDGASRIIYARAQAAAGEWVEARAMPPMGINIFEARRWQSLTRAASPDAALAVDFFEQGEVAPELPTPAASPLQPSSGLFLPPEMLTVYEQHLTAFTSVLTTQFTEQLTRTVTQLQAGARHDGYIFGGKFPHIDLASVIVQAEMQRETGYVRVAWNPAHVETTILAGRLSPLARCGIGFVWMLDGTIIDATLCTEEPAPALSGNLSAALSDLTALLQIGVGIGLDHRPEGEALCYPDARVRSRPARIQIPAGTSQNLMQSLIVERETQLGKTLEEDIIGEWEK